MNEPSPIVPTSIDPVEAAMTAAGLQQAPTPQPVPESDSAANLEAEKAPLPEERRARQYAEAAEAKKRAARAEAEARRARQDFQAQQASLAKEKADLEAMVSGAKGNRAVQRELLKRFGLTLDDLARTELELEAEPLTPDVVAKSARDEVQALRKELADRDRAVEEQKLIQQRDEVRAHYLNRVQELITAEPTDKFQLIKDNESYPLLLERCALYLQEHGITDVSPEDEALLVDHLGEKLEAELFSYAENAAKRLQKSTKLHKLLGINSPSITATEAIRNNDTASLSPEESALLDELTQETTAAARGNKFITNDATVSSRPTTVAKRDQTEIDREIDELVKAYGGGK